MNQTDEISALQSFHPGERWTAKGLIETDGSVHVRWRCVLWEMLKENGVWSSAGCYAGRAPLGALLSRGTIGPRKPAACGWVPESSTDGDRRLELGQWGREGGHCGDDWESQNQEYQGGGR